MRWLAAAIVIAALIISGSSLYIHTHPHKSHGTYSPGFSKGSGFGNNGDFGDNGSFGR
jgi:hypothetical protein